MGVEEGKDGDKRDKREKVGIVLKQKTGEKINQIFGIGGKINSRVEHIHP